MLDEREYYDRMELATHNGDCDRCLYGYEGECHLQCRESYEDYIDRFNEWMANI